MSATRLKRTPPEPFISRRELAELLGIHINTVDRWVAEGMPSHKWGKVRRFKASQCVEWAERRS